MLMMIDKGKVIQFLLDRKITVKELAQRAGISIQSVTNAAHGKKLRIPSVAKIAAAMGITPNDLIVGGEV